MLKTKSENLGELVPCGGGDVVPLFKRQIIIGRRESCDIVLTFNNISGHHCKMTLEEGYWFIRDLNSRNGTKVDGRRIVRKRLDPDVVVSIAKHNYQVKYNPFDLGATGPPPPDDDVASELMRRSLLDRAGLVRRSKRRPEANKKIWDD